LDVFPRKFLKVVWYLVVNAWCGLDAESVFKIKA
jgi:hypothetical protein